MDADNCVAERAGMGIPEIFKEHGEEYFRDLETEFLEALVFAGYNRLVLATGGGMVERERNHEFLRRLGRPVYLKADLETLLARIPSDPHRPLLKDPQFIKDRFARRQPLYQALAAVTIVTAGKTTALIENELLDALGLA
jgi:shikimate kinase